MVTNKFFKKCFIFALGLVVSFAASFMCNSVMGQSVNPQNSGRHGSPLTIVIPTPLVPYHIRIPAPPTPIGRLPVDKLPRFHRVYPNMMPGRNRIVKPYSNYRHRTPRAYHFITPYGSGVSWVFPLR